MRRMSTPLLSLCAGLMLLTACTQEPETPPMPEVAPQEEQIENESAAPAESQPAAALPQPGKFALTLEDIEGYQKGMARENEMLTAAVEKVKAAQSDEEKMNAMMAAMPQNIEPMAAASSGLSNDRYEDVKESIGSILGAIEMNSAMQKQYQDLDTSGMDEATALQVRENAAQMQAAWGDPFKDIAPEVADALRARQDELARLRAENIGLLFKAAGR